MKTRNYNKKSTYWEARKNTNLAVKNDMIKPIDFPEINYESHGQEAMADFCAPGNSTSTNRTSSTSDYYGKGFPNLNEYFIPYDVAAQNGYLSIADAIKLCQKAYVGYAPYRNTIETLVEFCNTKIHLKSKDPNAKRFITYWFKKIGLKQLVEQYFREYYRSGNVFFYRYDGEFTDLDTIKLKETYGGKTKFVPIRYIILNPTNVFVQSGITNRFTYVKMLSTYELERLKAPQTEEEKQMFQDLPDYIQKFLLSSGAVGLFRNIYIPIDPYRLYYMFYKKQPYEPLAIPLGLPLLKDIEHKLQLKKTDIALTRSLEFAMLLLTTGEKRDNFGGGVNPKNIKALQALFANQSVGRVLIGDYTTKGQWLIPDIKDLLGPQKYAQVDKDIEEGLRNILIGEQKFATASLKAKFFLKTIEGDQDKFLEEFLQPEIDRVSDAMGLKDKPKASFQKNSLQDDVQTARVYTQMAQLGLLTPPELNKAIETNILPDPDESIEDQKDFKESRDDGFYQPLIGGQPQQEAGRPQGTKAPQTKKTISPVGTHASEGFSTKKIVEHMKALDSLKFVIGEKLKKQFNVKELNEDQNSIVEILAKNIAINEKSNKWEKSIIAYIKDPKEINSEAQEEIDNIALKHQVDSETALLLYKSKTTIE
jgi:hypothetical protein